MYLKFRGPRIEVYSSVYPTRCNVTQFTTLTEVFPCFFLSCKANARVTFAKTGHGPHSSKLVVIRVVLSLFVLFCCYCVLLLLFALFCYYLCCFMYCLCVNVYCTTATECLPNCSWQIYHIIYIYKLLYMFRVVSLLIMRNTQLYLQHLVLVKPLLLPSAVVEELELLFQLFHYSGR